MVIQPTEKNFVDVCGATEISDGQARMFLVGETRIALYRIGDEVFALDDACPHAGASLALGIISGSNMSGSNMSGSTVACRIHHWRFCIRSGDYLNDNQKSSNVRTYVVRQVDSRIQVAV